MLELPRRSHAWTGSQWLAAVAAFAVLTAGALWLAHDRLSPALRPTTRLVWCESPGSITMEVQDLSVPATCVGLPLPQTGGIRTRTPLNAI